MLSLSLHVLAARNRDGKLSFELMVALASDETEQMEEEREERDVSDIIDSGEDVVDMFASDDRRAVK
jgi:hypothetical protein